MTGFGDFSPLCHQVPSYTWCNLFYRQVRSHSLPSSLPSFTFISYHLISFPLVLKLQHNNSTVLVGVSANPATAPVGVNPVCGIPIVGTDGSLANIGNIIACALSIILVAALVYFAYRRKAAVGMSLSSPPIISP